LTREALYITKKKFLKIRETHPKEYIELNSEKFQENIMHNTIGYCKYHKQDDIYNFVAIFDGNYYIYSISTNNHYLELGTFFQASKTRMKRCVKEDIEFFNGLSKKEFEEHIN